LLPRQFHPGRILHYPSKKWEGVGREGRRGGGRGNSRMAVSPRYRICFPPPKGIAVLPCRRGPATDSGEGPLVENRCRCAPAMDSSRGYPLIGSRYIQGNANLQKGIRAFSETKRTEPAATTLRRASLASNATSRADIARPDTRTSQRATHMTILGSPAPHCARAHAHAKHVLRRPAQAQSSH
jgi:hypothetical protein